MILRIWRGRTPADKADEYVEYINRTGTAEVGAADGNRGIRVVRNIENGEAEFLFISLWDSIDAIKKFAGEEYETPVYYPDDGKFLLEFEPRVRHFEVLHESGQ